MEEIYGWVRNITGYFIFLSVLENLIPAKKYTKYIRLFAGMVLILLVMQPLSRLLRLEERIAGSYEGLVFQYQAADLRDELDGAERRRLDQIVRRYEEAVAEDVGQMAEEEGFQVLTSRAEISREEEAEDFGTVTRIWLKVRLPGAAEADGGTLKAAGADSGTPKAAGADSGTPEAAGVDAETSPSAEELEPASAASSAGKINLDLSIEEIEPVPSVEKITPLSPGEDRETEDPGGDREQFRLRKEQENTAAGRLRKKIAAYYDLEEAYVEIQVVEGEG